MENNCYVTQGIPYLSTSGVIGLIQEKGLTVRTIETTDNTKTIEVNGKHYTATIDDIKSTNEWLRTRYPEQLMTAVCYRKAYDDLRN